MIVVTSISPFHSNKDNQESAIKSWQNICENIYSMNTENEIEQLENIYKGVIFFPTDRTIEHLVGKPLVTINAMIDIAKTAEYDLLITNSDIIIESLPELKEDGITILSRYDYNDHFGEGKIFNAGFDVVYIPKKFLNIFPHSIYAMGLSWWDYALPYRFILRGIPVYWPQGKYAFHKWHQTQYSVEEWVRIGEFFRLEFNINKQMNIGQVATNILAQIKSIAIKY